jgi:hypothetical protein
VKCPTSCCFLTRHTVQVTSASLGAVRDAGRGLWRLRLQ